MAYIPTIYCIDGECYVWYDTPIMEGLKKSFWLHLDKLKLMSYIDDKYWLGTFTLTTSFTEKVRKKYQNEIDKIFDGFDEGDIW